jgi:hypothetical protein
VGRLPGAGSWLRRHSRVPLVAVAVAGLATTGLVSASAATGGSNSRTVSVSACDPLDTTACLLPFPDDYFTVSDPSTPTGRRVDFPVSAMPKSVSGTPIDPTQWNRNDGFSPGSDILVHVPGIDLARSGVAPITDIGSSLRPDSAVVLLDAATGARVPYWGELDANDTNASEQALIIRPAVDFLDGHRYIVALRHLRDGSGHLIPAGSVFRAYRDGLPLATPAEEARRPHMESLLKTLSRHGVGRSDLYLAWDFTVASEQNLTGRLLHMRNQAFAQLGSAAPAFSVTSVTNFTTSQNAQIARNVTGTFSVPSYLNAPGGPPGSTLHYGPNGEPSQLPGNIQTANFTCNIPRSTVSDATNPGATVYPGRPMLYGHGLLGSASEINSSAETNMANEENFVICGTDWLGLSSADVGVDSGILSNISAFPTIPDRGQQAMLDFLFLGRLMTDPNGFDANPAFQVGSSSPPLIAPKGLVYYGNSQGGIYGGTLTAVSNIFTRAVLGVPGMNYSTLLSRSVDFSPFLAILNGSYPDKLEQQVIDALLQMLWDRSDPDGYAQHMTSDPLPGTPAHQVLLEEAFGDHQVANVATEVEARTIGAHAHEPALAPGRSPDVQPLWGIPPIPGTAFDGSSLFVWDSGSPAPPTTDTPPTAGADPHEVPRSQPVVRLQDGAFLVTGEVLDVCGGAPCQAVP